jgi:hypothetical protein
MNPFLSNEVAQEHIGDLRRSARASRVPEEPGELAGDEGLTVRAACQRDAEAVRLLAALEGVTMPSGPMLVAEVGDDVLAALPLDGGRALADPFRPSAHMVELLELRARQVRAEADEAQHSWFPRIRGVLRAA